jgi:ribosome maturation factor RimP
MVSTESIRELAGPVLASAGLELWDVEIARDVVRIMVDRPGGIDLDALTVASSALSPVLDTHPDVVPEGRYQLEISSPGVERTLRTPDQYRRYVDAEITVKTATPVEGARRHRGRLVEASESSIALEPDDAPGTRLQLRYDQIDRARTVLVWGPTPARPVTRRPAPGSRSTTDRGAPVRRAASSRAAADPNPKDAG